MVMHLERLDLAMQLKNNKKMTILVSGASGIVGYGILRTLRNEDCILIGTTIYDESPADCFADIVEKPPVTTDKNYISWLLKIIEKYNIDMIIPGIEIDMQTWNRHRNELKSTCVLLNNPSLIEICSDKWMFYQKLQKSGFRNYIETSLDMDYDKFPTPFILKPRCGFGSKGIVKIESEEQFNLYRHEIGKSLMMQEYVGSENEEYTISAFFDKNSQLKAQISMRRSLSKLGYTAKAEVVDIPDIKQYILELAEIFKPIGPTNFQFRKHQGEWRLLEINPRISSSTSIRNKFGYNEGKMCIDYFLKGEEVNQPLIKRGKAIRYIEDYITYDSNNI